PSSMSGAFGTNRTDPVEARMFNAVSSFGDASSGLGEWGDKLAAVGTQTMSLSTTLSPLYSPSLGTGPLANQLTLCARIINARLGVRVLNVVYAPFDTHVDQIADQGTALAEIDRSIQAFYAALDPVWNGAVTMMTWSEFGRRVEFNGSGTDHGTASCMFV